MVILAKVALHNEEALIRQLSEGDPQAFTDLYHFYSGPMFVNVLKMVKDEDTAHEIVQQLFTSVWQKSKQIDPDKNFAGYLYRIGQNIVHDFYNNLKKDQRLYNHFKAIATENYTHIEEALTLRENAEILEKAIQDLPAQQQLAFRLIRLDGMSYKEAAERMDISLNTLKEHFSKANKSVRDYLGRNHEATILLIIALMLRQP